MENQTNVSYDENVVANEAKKILSATVKPPFVEPTLLKVDEETKDSEYRIITNEAEEAADDLLEYTKQVAYGGLYSGAENLTSDEKDELWGTMQDRLVAYQELFSSLKYSMYFTNDEIRHLSAIFNNHLQFDIDTVFWGVKFENDMQEMVKMATEKRGDGIHKLEYTYQQIQVMILLLKTYKFTGIGGKGRLFYNILLKITNATNANLFLETVGNNCSNELQKFIANITNEEETRAAMVEGKL